MQFQSKYGLAVTAGIDSSVVAQLVAKLG
jgi:hypothetical protein